LNLLMFPKNELLDTNGYFESVIYVELCRLWWKIRNKKV
jgi:hypothetical protein